MADETIAPETDAPEAPDQPEPEKGTGEPDQAADNAHERLPDDHPVVKALKKANEEAAAARRKVKEYEDANLTELERAQSAATSEKERADEAELKVARLEAVLDFKLSKTDLDLIGGVTPDEIRERAERLAARIGAEKSERDRSPDPRLGRTDQPESSKDALGRALFGV